MTDLFFIFIIIFVFFKSCSVVDTAFENHSKLIADIKTINLTKNNCKPFSNDNGDLFYKCNDGYRRFLGQENIDLLNAIYY